MTETFTDGDKLAPDLSFELSKDRTLSLSDQEPIELEPGVILLEKFKVLNLLGQGGMGSVYRVEHLLMDKHFALKCLNKFQAADASWRRFQNEAKAAYLLDHANLIKVFEVGLLPGGQPFFLMELIEGNNLSDEIKNHGHLPVDRAIKIFIQVAFAIGYAHDRRVIHRDLKPSNIMIVPPRLSGSGETIKVVDFGIAKLTGLDEFNQQNLTKTGEIFGSPLYMSPEQCIGLPVDHRSDLYSLGCVMYETLTSAPPFMGENALSTMMQHQTERPISLKEASLGLQFPAKLETIIGKLLEKEPERRYQSADSLAADLIALERTLIDPDNAPGGTSLIANIAKKMDAIIEPPKGEKLRAPKSELLSDDEKIQPESPVSKKHSPTLLAGVGILIYALGFASAYLIYHQDTKTALSTEKQISATPETVKKATEAPVKDPTPWSVIRGDTRQFNFPAQSLGTLSSEKGQMCQAQGRVIAPVNQKFSLTGSSYLFSNPDFMDRFRPDEIIVLDTKASKIVDSRVFKKLARWKGLKALNVSSAAFGDNDLKYLDDLTELVYLNLCVTDVKCASLFKSKVINRLQCIDVSHCDGAGAVLPQFSELPGLSQLVVSGCELSNGDLAGLSQNETIKVLCLSANSITNQGLSHLTGLKSLQWLDISKTLVTPDCIEFLKKMPALNMVELGQNDWSPEVRAKFITELKKTHPKVKVRWEDVLTYENHVSMPNFIWNGKGLHPHINLKRFYSRFE